LQKKRIESFLKSDLGRVERVFASTLSCDNPFARKMLTHIEKGGGKRIRPILVLLSAKAFGEVTSSVVALGASVEMLHVATLVHDDIIDNATLRRNRPTLNSKWGNEGSVLLGDFLFSSAFTLMARHLPAKILETVAATTHTICRGEISETFHRCDIELTEDEYLTIVAEKTASLFSTACQTSAMLVGADDAGVEALRRYGMALGMAFQLVDDALDVDGSPERMGKPKRCDVLEGKLTLPVLHLLQRSHGNERRMLVKVLSKPQKNSRELQTIYRLLRERGSADYTRRRAEEYARQAVSVLNFLPQNHIREAFTKMTGFVARRDF
jgi:octaprenyl-diphosphate synthase